ncbi:hypothetical protein [Mucilaginibacter sp. HD30]
MNFNFNKLYIIWISDEEDSVVVNEFGKILAFDNNEVLHNYLMNNTIAINKDVTTYEIDKLQQWVLTPTNKFDKEQFLNFWNLCTDTSVGVKKPFIGDIKTEETNTLYDKLFDAAGPFIAEDPNPVFSETEILKLRDIMRNGLALLLDNLVIK